jgi:transposase
MTEKEDLAMKNKRTFSLEFKRQVVEELLSGESGAAQLCRRHDIGASLLYHWKKQYSLGKFNNEPDNEAALKDRVEKLERLVGKLTLENEFLKRGLWTSHNQPGGNGKSSRNWKASSAASNGGVL